MAVIPTGTELFDLVPHISRTSTGDCDLCCDPLFSAPSDRGVYWHLGDTDIWLHAACAERLGVHLIQDARSARQAAGARW
jgi:hypothetical protein